MKAYFKEKGKSPKQTEIADDRQQIGDSARGLMESGRSSRKEQPIDVNELAMTDPGYQKIYLKSPESSFEHVRPDRAN